MSETRLPRFHALCRLLHATILECPPPTSWDEFNEVRRGATSPTVGALWMPRSSLRVAQGERGSGERIGGWPNCSSTADRQRAMTMSSSNRLGEPLIRRMER